VIYGRRQKIFTRKDHLVVGVDVYRFRVPFDSFLPLARLERFVAWKNKQKTRDVSE